MVKTTMTGASKVESPEISSGNTELVPRIVPTATNENISLQITTHKLNGMNFLQWSRSAQMVVRGKGKIGFLMERLLGLTLLMQPIRFGRCITQLSWPG